MPSETSSDMINSERGSEELRTSEQLFHSIFENAQIGIGVFEIENQKHFCNRALRDMLGYSQVELNRLGQWDEMVPFEERAACSERYGELVQGIREQDEYEQHFVCRDGRMVLTRSRFQLLRNSTGAPQYVVALTEDITEHRQSAEALAASEQLFRTVFENAQIGIGILDTRTGKHVSNRAQTEMLGYALEELSRIEQWDKIVHADDRDASAKRYAEIIGGKREHDEFRLRFIHRDGHIVTGSGKFKLIRDGSGKPHYVIALHEDITERVRAQEALLASEQLFRTIFENAQIGISVLNVIADEYHTNQALHDMLGCTHEDLNSLEKWDRIVDPNERALGAQRYTALLAGHHERDQWEQRFVRRDGRLVIANGRFSVIRNAAGQPHYVLSFTEDITEKKHAEEKLKRSEELFRSVFENAQIGIGIFDLNTGEHLVNRAQTRMLGYSHEELSHTKQWDEIVHPEDRAFGANRYAELVQGLRDEDEYTQRFIRRDGQISIQSGRFTLIRDEAGKPQHLIALHEDITERKAAEELIRKREAELRQANFLAETALDLTRAGYWHVPLDGSGLFNSSPRRDAIFGETSSPDFRYPLEQVFAHAKEADELAAATRREAFNAAVEGKTEKYDSIYAYKRPVDGQVIWIHALGHVVTDSTGKPTDIYGVSQDITEFKRLEEELLSAKEAAETATKVKSEFLANMSHEIRTPMNAILGMTHLALRTELTPKQHDYLTKTKAAAEGLLGIINDILDFSKIEAGKLTMEHTDFRLDTVLEHLSTVVSPKICEKKLEFLIDEPLDLPAVLVGDQLRLGQVLINLVNNAVKFTERGEIVVTIRLEERLSDQVKLKFDVRDSGIGMTPEQSSRLFQAFSQADTSTTRKYGGTGLGLSISKRLVEMMEGNIWVESEFGRGSTFCFTAWFGIADAETRSKKLSSGFASIRALVVDDNAMARDILAHALSQLLPRVDCVSSGEEALEKLAGADEQDPYQFIMVDWQMPGLDGLEASRIIKQGGRLKNVPRIVMITAFDREEIRAQAEEMGIEALIQKPVSQSVLFDTLVNIFGSVSEQASLGKVSKVEVQSYDAGGVRVLLVEDNEVNQQIATELLESVGASVTVANHGGEAIGLLTEGEQPPPFDIVFMDLQMPEVDGFTAAAILRARPDLRNLPIVAMTAHAMTDEIQRCLSSGMNDHVGKPIDPSVLFATLARWTRDKRGDSASPVKQASAGQDILLPEIEGVDIANGLQRVVGNKRLYRDLLLQFVQTQHRVDERIAAAVESGDHSLAERLAHSLKGVAGNLGIRTIVYPAAQLEGAIRNRAANILAMTSELGTVLERQIQTIEQALKSSPPAVSGRVSAPPADPAAVKSALARLRQLLQNSDADALESYFVLAELLQGTSNTAQLESLGTAINQFDFDAALVQLEGIAHELCPDVPLRSDLSHGLSESS